MRRLIVLLLALALLASHGFSALSEDDSWIVEEEEEQVELTSRYLAGVLRRRMTTEQKVYQLFLVAPEALTGEEYTTLLTGKNPFSARPVGGVVIFGQNIVSEAQLKQLTADLQQQSQAAGGFPLLMAVTEQGGVYSRVASKLGYSPLPSPREIGEKNDVEAAREAGQSIAGYLAPLGINLDFAPVLDVGEARSYDDSAPVVSRLGVAMAQGLRNGGVTPCCLHFPGQRDMTQDVNTAAAALRRTVKQMRSEDWVPFRQAIAEGAEMILVSHGILKDGGDTLPASLSQAVINGYLRGQLGFDGVVITDSLRMGAITGTFRPGVAAVRALQAGADALLLPAQLDEAAQGILAALKTGAVSEDRLNESVDRILALKIDMGLIQ